MDDAGLNESQQILAKALGLSLAGLSSSTAAALLHDAVAEAILDAPRCDSSERQRAFANSLGLDVASDSLRVASAKISEALFRRNQEALVGLQLHPGDAVVRTTHYEHNGESLSEEREFVVSSIGPNLRVFFKGGNGQGAWPTQLRRA